MSSISFTVILSPFFPFFSHAARAVGFRTGCNKPPFIEMHNKLMLPFPDSEFDRPDVLAYGAAVHAVREKESDQTSR
ncbi:hypothetical protein F4859DRAFT_417767 [Xylaria cf. heliscus]|nr:hypothetical protein F4859DRAFT_417767 [Xylaria cf. heliscus]